MLKQDLMTDLKFAGFPYWKIFKRIFMLMLQMGRKY